MSKRSILAVAVLLATAGCDVFVDPDGKWIINSVEASGGDGTAQVFFGGAVVYVTDATVTDVKWSSDAELAELAGSSEDPGSLIGINNQPPPTLACDSEVCVMAIGWITTSRMDCEGYYAFGLTLNVDQSDLLTGKGKVSWAEPHMEDMTCTDPMPPITWDVRMAGYRQAW
ncbi:MAG: hypothetical protein V2A73_16805 [Pseudomonadota bacterium]